jgi:serine/threonine protein kinase
MLNTSLVKASIRELYGLATALAAAHFPKTAFTLYRHGDLRPDNIFRFHGVDIIGTLKIGDWGEIRKNSSISTGTLRYEAPELDVQFRSAHFDHATKRRSRVSDIWSMGCVILEYMIWLLYGAEGLEMFEEELPPGSSFYQLAKDRYDSSLVVNTVVVKWMNSMADHFACKSGSALGRLLELVKTGLLVVKLPRRMEMEMKDESGIIPAVAPREDFANPDLPSIVISDNDPVDLRHKFGIALDIKTNSEPARLNALEFERIIQGIFSQDEATEEYWLPNATRLLAPTQEFLDKKEHQQNTENFAGQEPVVSPTERDVTFPRPERVSSSSASLSA